jgi:nickel-dependent lactate racemase
MLTGIGALVVGVAFTLLALAVNSATVFFAGTTRSEVGFGRSFQGGTRTVVPRVAARERAGCCAAVYRLLSWPRSTRSGPPASPSAAPDLIGAAEYYGAALMLLAVLDLLALLRVERKEGKRS